MPLTHSVESVGVFGRLEMRSSPLAPSRFAIESNMHLRFSIKFVLVPSVRMDYIASTLFILFIFILLSIKHQFLIVCITIRQILCPCVHFQFAFLSTSRCLLRCTFSFSLRISISLSLSLSVFLCNRGSVHIRFFILYENRMK